MFNMTCLKLVCLALLAGAALGKVVEHGECVSGQDICSVSEVRIDPCRKYPCKLKKGTPASISVDFTPNFSASKLKTGLSWASDGGDVPFPDLWDTNACEMTSCPLESGKQQQYNYSLRLGKKLPSGTFVFKWELWDEDNRNQSCCFKTTVVVTR